MQCAKCTLKLTDTSLEVFGLVLSKLYTILELFIFSTQLIVFNAYFLNFTLTVFKHKLFFICSVFCDGKTVIVLASVLIEVYYTVELRSTTRFGSMPDMPESRTEPTSELLKSLRREKPLTALQYSTYAVI